MHRDPAHRVVVGLGAHDPFDPHVVGGQLGELILELLEIDRRVDGNPYAVDSVCSRAVEMTTLVGMVVNTNLAIWLAI